MDVNGIILHCNNVKKLEFTLIWYYLTRLYMLKLHLLHQLNASYNWWMHAANKCTGFGLDNLCAIIGKFARIEFQSEFYNFYKNAISVASEISGRAKSLMLKKRLAQLFFAWNSVYYPRDRKIGNQRKIFNLKINFTLNSCLKLRVSIFFLKKIYSWSKYLTTEHSNFIYIDWISTFKLLKCSFIHAWIILLLQVHFIFLL